MLRLVAAGNAAANNCATACGCRAAVAAVAAVGVLQQLQLLLATTPTPCAAGCLMCSTSCLTPANAPVGFAIQLPCCGVQAVAAGTTSAALCNKVLRRWHGCTTTSRLFVQSGLRERLTRGRGVACAQLVHVRRTARVSVADRCCVTACYCGGEKVWYGERHRCWQLCAWVGTERNRLLRWQCCHTQATTSRCQRLIVHGIELFAACSHPGLSTQQHNSKLLLQNSSSHTLRQRPSRCVQTDCCALKSFMACGNADSAHADAGCAD